ncbi:DUF4245 family protein [Kocuria rhizophila]
MERVSSSASGPDPRSAHGDHPADGAAAHRSPAGADGAAAVPGDSGGGVDGPGVPPASGASSNPGAPSPSSIEGDAGSAGPAPGAGSAAPETGPGGVGSGTVNAGDAEQPVPQLTTKQAARINAPIRGMVISMVVLMLLLLPFLWLQPKPDGQPYRANVDVGQEAAFVADQAPFTPAAPQLPEGWSANYARWTENSEDGVPLWNVGYLSPEYHLVDLVQTSEPNPTWLAQRTEQAPQIGEKTVGGVTWALHHREVTDKQEEYTAWVADLKDSTVVLSGKAPDAEFEQVAQALSGS